MDEAASPVFRTELAAAARRLLATCDAVTIIHHNDADGLCCAAALSRGLQRAGRPRHQLLPLEKIHESAVAAICAARPGCLIYADLGGQNARLIERETRVHGNPLVLILDHHLPESATGGALLHLNPELHGIDGDRDMSGASVCALFAAALAGAAGRSEDLGAFAVYGVIGACGDGQLVDGRLQGANAELERQALACGALRAADGGWRVPVLGDATVAELVEDLDALGSIGFYSGTTELGVRYLLGRDSAEARRTAAELRELKRRLFHAELDRQPEHVVAGTPSAPAGRAPWQLAWVDVADRFQPMGVKAIGLFLEELSRQTPPDAQVYFVGFQRLPAEQPGLGPVGGELTKVSARVSPGLRTRIEAGQAPDLMTLVPRAIQAVGGTADGCHRYSAAAVIARGREQAFVAASLDALKASRARTEG